VIGCAGLTSEAISIAWRSASVRADPWSAGE
jgi:hypothetical protein